MPAKKEDAHSNAAKNISDIAENAEIDPIIEEAFLTEVKCILFISGAEKAEPSMYCHTIKHPDVDQWKKAVEKEMEAHARNGT